MNTVAIEVVFGIMFGSIVLFVVAEHFACRKACRYVERIHGGNGESTKSIQRSCWIRYILIFWLGMINGVIWTTCITLMIQLLVGELRPDFLDRVTTKNANLITKGRLSFPSGHTSVSFAWATFVSIYTFHLLFITTDRKPRQELLPSSELEDAENSMTPSYPTVINEEEVIGTGRYLPILLRWELKYTVKGLAVSIPLFWALLVGISRIIDHRHHVWDVLGGACLGMGISALVFLQTCFGYVSREIYLISVMN
jgi:hypothetical protein